MTGIFDSPEFKERLRADMEALDRQRAAREAWLTAHRADPPVPIEDLVLERKAGASDGAYVTNGAGLVMSLPPVTTDVDFWRYRVYLGHGQAVVGFGKHFTVGVAFFDEVRSEGTDFPCRTHASRIWNHIKDNNGYHDISDEACVRAIEMVQQAAVADNPEARGIETEAESRERSPYLWDPEWNTDCAGRKDEHRCIYGSTDHVERAEMNENETEAEPHKCTCGEEWT